MEVTSTLTVQVPGDRLDPDGITPPMAGLSIPIEITCVPAVAVRVGVTVPPSVQLVLALGRLAIFKPAGRVSVNAAPVYFNEEGFCRVMVSLLIPPD